MTDDEFISLISRTSAPKLLKSLSEMPKDERRAHAGATMKFYRLTDRYWSSDSKELPPKVKDQEAVALAVICTASGSELRRMAWFPRLRSVPMADIVRAIKPDWTQSVVEHFIEDRPVYIDHFAPLWQEGLCERPTSDALILGYYSHWGTTTLDEESALDGDVWRFFEVGGGGEFSLANHEKYLKRGMKSWTDRLLDHAASGRLDRQRLLDASLDALKRDFSQFVAGWYSRFHDALEPTDEEREARAPKYLELLYSSVPPTISFALKHVERLARTEAVSPHELVRALDAPLQSRAKGTVTTALRLIEKAAKSDPSLSEEAAEKTLLALISDNADVQSAAMNVIEGLDITSEQRRASLSGLAEQVQPSVRAKLRSLIGEEAAPESETPVATLRLSPDAILPAQSADDALARFLAVLEDPSDPFAVEVAVDGVARFGADLRKSDSALSPLKKRAGQLLSNPGEVDVKLVLAITGRALAEGRLVKDIAREVRKGQAVDLIPGDTLQSIHLERNAALIDRVFLGGSLPMLSLPSDTSGRVQLQDLMSRINFYREASLEPDETDLALALLRLSREDRGGYPDSPVETEADRAIAYVLGRQVRVGPSSNLWAAAWKARAENVEDNEIAALFGEPQPNCGIVANVALQVKREQTKDGKYRWIKLAAPVEPGASKTNRAIPALFGRNHKHFSQFACAGHTFPDIAWAGLANPEDSEPFFRLGILQQDSWQKLTNNPTRAFLEPFFRTGPTFGPLGAAILVYYMACEDKSVSALAAEATTTAALTERLSVQAFSEPLSRFVLVDALPNARWASGLKTIAERGAGDFVRDVLSEFFTFAPERTPSAMGPFLELMFELHVAKGEGVAKPETRDCLAALPGGGKVAKFSKQLLKLDVGKKPGHNGQAS